MRKFRDLMRDDRGGTLIEYALILALIFLVMSVAVHALAIQVTGTLNHVKNEVVNAGDT